MFDPVRVRFHSKAMISLLLCTALTLNMGCHSNQQRTQELQKENVEIASTQAKNQDIDPMDKEPQPSSEESNVLKKTLDGVGEFADGVVELSAYVALGAVIVGILFLEYEGYRLIYEAL